MTNKLDEKNLIIEKIEKVRSNYQHTGDASTALLAAEALCFELEVTTGLNRSLEFARLYTFVCDLRLSLATNIEDLRAVSKAAENSIQILQSMPGVGSESIQALASANLYLAVAQKASSDNDESLRTLKIAKRDLRKFFSSTYVDEVMLTRQEALLYQEERLFKEILDEVPKYIVSHPHEAYASSKRVFEYCLNNGKIRLAKALVPLLKETYRQAAHRLPKIAKISFIKNLGHYHLQEGDLARATKYLTLALNASKEMGFVGQMKQINALLNNVGNIEHAFLETFKL